LQRSSPHPRDIAATLGSGAAAHGAFSNTQGSLLPPEIKAYVPWVTVGSYIVMADTHLDGTHWVDHAAGPMAATRVGA
jgi:hypothetical protein